MQKSLTQTFNESAAAAHEAFPRELEYLVILSTASETPVYVSPEIAEHLSRNVDAVREAVEEKTNYLHTRNASGVTNPCYPLAGEGVTLISMNGDIKANPSSRYTRRMQATFSLDHEIGHLVVENGHDCDNMNLRECAADAYAALRHIQRFGKDTELLEYNNTSLLMVFGISPAHYTNAVIQKVRQLAEETDISGLSLRETAELAEKIANEHQLSVKRLEKIRSAFLPVNTVYRIDGSLSDTLIDAFTIALEKHRDDPDISRAGKQFLNHPSVKNFVQTRPPAG